MATYKKWTQHEIDYIVNHHASLRDEQIAETLSQISGDTITTSMIRRQRRKLSIKKNRGRPKKFTSITSNTTPVENV